MIKFLFFKARYFRRNFLFLLLLFVSSCVYRFSLVSRESLGRYQSIYIARSLNPSGSTLPSDIFEEEVQKSFIQNFPDISLTSLTYADLYLRITYQNLAGEFYSEEVLQKGAVSVGPNDYQTEEGLIKQPLALEDLKLGPRSNLSEVLSLGVKVEIWDLVQRKMIFSKLYLESGQYRVLFSPKSRLLEVESHEAKLLVSLSKSIAGKMLGDLVHVL